MLHEIGGFKVKHFAGVIGIYVRRTPVAMATKIWEF